MEFDPDDAKLALFDAAEYILTDEDIRLYLEADIEDSSTAEIADALNVVIRAKGLMRLSADTGLTRQQLHRILNPEGMVRSRDELMKIYLALGVDAAKKSDAAE